MTPDRVPAGPRDEDPRPGHADSHRGQQDRQGK